jgi:dTDP-glucose 4,6-dehydratase
MSIKNKKIFLSGGAGFIGSHITMRLIEDNQIVVYDNLRRNSIKNTNLVGHKNLTIIEGDVLDIEKLRAAMAGSNLVLNLAAIAGIDTVIKDPVNTMRINMIGTYNVCEAAKDLDECERFVQFSTSEVFGSYAYKLEEHDNTTCGCVGEARWTYAVSKLAGEHLVHSYYRVYGLPIVTVRPFNIYGPGQVGEGAIHHFVKRAILDEDIEIHGDGDQIRSWCYIDDIIDGIMLCLQKPEAIAQVFNIGNHRTITTIYNLAMTIVNVLRSKSRVRFVPKNYIDVELRIPNIEKAKELLGFSPKVELEEGIKRTADWYRKQLIK